MASCLLQPGAEPLAFPHQDLDRDGGATLDIAVGAEQSDNDANGETNVGAVYVLSVDTATGQVRNRWYKLQHFEGVDGGSYPIGALGDGANFGASVACLGDLNGDGDIEMAVGIPGYGEEVSNNLNGGWVTIFLAEVHAPSPAPTAHTTSSPTATAEPSTPPTVPPSFSPSGLPSAFPSRLPSAV